MLIAFIISSSVFLMIPGPTILTVISYSISHGYKVKIPLICAVTLGDSTALVLSLLGLGTLLASSAVWFTIVKYMGGLYLIYLGIKLFKSGISSKIEEKNENISSVKLLLNTYLVTALNPKGIIFFVAFLPQFINQNSNVTQQLWILAITFVSLAALNATFYAIFANRAKKLLASNKTQKIFNLTGGSLLAGVGFLALSAKTQ